MLIKAQTSRVDLQERHRRLDQRPTGPSGHHAGAALEVPRQVLIAELLELCDGFFSVAGPVVRLELAGFLISRGLHPGTALGWFCDVLSLTAAAEGRAACAGCGGAGAAPVE